MRMRHIQLILVLISENKSCRNYLPNDRTLAIKSTGHGNRSQYSVSCPVKYKVRHRGHSSIAFNRPISEKNSDT